MTQFWTVLKMFQISKLSISGTNLFLFGHNLQKIKIESKKTKCWFRIIVFFKRMYSVPLHELICEGEFPIQENLDVHHLLSEDVLALQKVAGDLGFM